MKSEFEFIKHLKANIQNRKSAVGIGDDCAVIRQNSQKDLVITTDLLVEDIDFRRDWIQKNPEFLGHKTLAVSLSDIAAMGATPNFALVSVGLPKDVWKTDFAEKFYNGWLALANNFGVELIGGDISETPDKIIVDSIVIGEVKQNKAVLRSTAKIGDLIFVTGSLGGASAGLKLLENGARLKKDFGQISDKNVLPKFSKKIILHELDEPEISALKSGKLNAEEQLLLRQLFPQPTMDIGKTLAKKDLATAMIDLSDGLSSDLAHLCEASEVGAIVYAEKIPLDINLETIAKDFAEKLNFALNGGEDFELLFTANPKNAKKIARRFGNSATCIGEITNDKIEIARNGKTSLLAAKGFRHF